VHREHDETFFVVQGTVRFTSGADTLLASPGQLVTAPIGDPHTFANADEQAPASLLCSVTPERTSITSASSLSWRPERPARSTRPECSRSWRVTRRTPTGAD